MSDSVQKALFAYLSADPGVQSVLGGAIYHAPSENMEWPHLLIGRSESRPYAADGEAIEHVLTLTARSRFGGRDECLSINAAIYAALGGKSGIDGGAVGGLKVKHLRPTYQDVFRAADWQKTLGVTRVRLVSENAPSNAERPA